MLSLPLQRWSSRLPVHVVILASSIAVSLILVGFDVWRTWQAHDQVLAADVTETANLVRSLAQHAQDMITEADTVLVDLRERVEAAGVDRERLHQVMAQRVAMMPMSKSLVGFDAAGDWTASSFPPEVAQHNNADRPYFRSHATHADRGLYLGAPVRSKVDDSWLIPLSRRVDGADGRFGGVVVATLSIDALQRFYGTFELDEGDIITLSTDEAVVLAHAPEVAGLVGTARPGGPMAGPFARHSPFGTARYVSRVDQVRRQASYRRVEGTALYVVVSHAVDGVLAPWRRDGLVHLGISAGAAAAVIFIGLQFARQIRTREAVEMRYRLLADNSSDAILTIARNGRTIYVSPAFTTLTGWSIPEGMARKWASFAHANDRESVEQLGARLDAVQRPISHSYRLIRKDGALIWVEVRIQLARGYGRGAPFIANMRDITERQQAEEKVAALNRELARLVNIDVLTGIANRRCLDERLDQEWRRCARAGAALSLLMIDVDHFKLFNDRFGHQGGDACLAAVAGAIAATLRRPGDLVARYGGEEMVVLLPETDPVGAAEVAESVRGAIQGLALPHPDNPPHGVATASVGVATLWPGAHPDAHGMTQLYNHADAAMYAAKRAGRNRVAVMDAPAEGQLQPAVARR